MRSDHLSKHKRTHKKGAGGEDEKEEEEGLIDEDDVQMLEINIDGMPSMHIVKNLSYAQEEEDEDEELKEAEDCE